MRFPLVGATKSTPAWKLTLLWDQLHHATGQPQLFKHGFVLRAADRQVRLASARKF
jgi:hypothetical protein